MKLCRYSAALCACTALGIAVAKVGPLLPSVDADLPAGNILVEDITTDDVYLRPSLRDTAGDWFYWHFRVSYVAQQKLTFHFTHGNPIGVRGPAVSTDGGQSWQWLGAQAVQGTNFSYTFGEKYHDIRFCVAFPYTEKNITAFLAGHTNNPHLKVATLCQTKEGRNAELLYLGRLDGRAEQKVVLTCRHHCCEMMASFVLEGIIEGVLAETAEGRWLREHVEFFVVPFVDKDGVEAGDQGKNRKPHDHNRDYAGNSLYPTVFAIRRQVPQWGADKLRVALDLHCPTLRGGGNEQLVFVGGPDTNAWREAQQFTKILEATQTGPLHYSTTNNLPFGKGWNTPANFTAGLSFARWATALPGVRWGATLETPYANAGGVAVTDASARALGHDLARALQKYLADAVSGK
ncbi:MAG: M14 family zinc carboxypeptidase [Kiritimatiellaeota bacterium]|nr:M14 family zinc carboxypeptidase [Kiritimatiellota bacterium]